MQFFFEILSKFSDFVNSDDCIGKINQNLSDYNQFLLKKGLKLIQNHFSSEKMGNSGNSIYDYAHSFFGGENF